MPNEKQSNGFQTRARPRARTEPEVVGIHVPPEAGRIPRVGVDVALPGGIGFRVVVSRKRRGGINVALPLTRDGERALFLPDDLRAEVEALAKQAVRADPAAWERVGQSATTHYYAGKMLRAQGAG